MDFMELTNRRLDHVKAYNSKAHYDDYRYRCKQWVQLWGRNNCNEITADMIQRFIIRRSRVSAYTANKDLRSLRSLFNFGKKRNWISANPTTGLDFLPVEKKAKYVPHL